MKNLPKRLSIWAAVVAAILMIPFVAQMPWSAGDFIFAGVVLFGLATVYELATRNIKNVKYRVIVGAVIVTVLILIWAWAVAGP